MSLVESTVSEIVRGRLKLPTSAKLRIQKSIPDALQIFSERMAEDDNKRHIVLTPKTVTGTPILGQLDLGDLVTSNGLMIDKLHLGDIYNQPIRTFTAADVDLSENIINLPNSRLTDYVAVNFTTDGVLPAPLRELATYYIQSATRDGSQLGIYTGTAFDRVVLTSVGMGTQTITTPDVPEEQPLSELTNPEATSFPVAWMDSADDKFWWLIGSTLYVRAGDGSNVTTVLQFNVPHIVTLAEFGTSPALGSLQDEFIDVVTELTATAEAKSDNGTP